MSDEPIDVTDPAEETTNPSHLRAALSRALVHWTRARENVRVNAALTYRGTEVGIQERAQRAWLYADAFIEEWETRHPRPEVPPAD